MSIQLQLWDIAGQERFSSMTRVYYKQATACVIIFDITRYETSRIIHLSLYQTIPIHEPVNLFIILRPSMFVW